MLQLFLFLHVLGAIVVFGPTFIFPVIGLHASRDPQHGHFAAVLSEFIERRIVIPGAVVQGITGVALILVIGADLSSPLYRWLGAAIVLYLIAIGFAIFVQAPAAERMVRLTAGGPPAPGAGAAPAGPPAGTPPGPPPGPPPELAATVRALNLGGRFLGLLVVLIVFLMVVKPGY